ncbi:nitroreductase [Mycena pura]|uniref:Nitroreductase n=1 Tax=Mycena pura TaxID=153505 RepID=A0AAD6UNB5_9AGAR|nr:nitroreductase [Mycena pura]
MNAMSFLFDSVMITASPSPASIPAPVTTRDGSNELAALVDRLLRERYSARYYLPDKIERHIIEEIVDAANCAPSGNNMQPWRVYCIAGDVKNAMSAEMVQAHKHKEPYAARYEYYPPASTFPSEYAARRFAFGKFFYGHLGIARDNLAARDAVLISNYEFYGAPVALIFTINSELRQGSWMDLGHFMQSITIGARARGLESVTQLSVPKYDEIIRKHLPIAEDELVACAMAIGYPDLEKITEHYHRPPKRSLADVLEIHGM